jgi:hypothetical protein
MLWTRLLLTYSAVASLAAAGLLTLRGEWVAPTVLSVVALLAVAVRVGLDADLRLNLGGHLTSITPRRERVGGVLVAALLVSASLAAPLGGASPVEPAAATHECSATEQLVTFSFGLTGYAADKLVRNGECTESHRAEAIEQLKESDAAQTKLDIYNAALQQKAQSEATGALYDNYLNDTEAAAWMQAEMAIAAAYDNGSSEAIAESKAKEAIADYYAVKQRNLISNWNASAAGVVTAWDVADNETGISTQYVDLEGVSIIDEDGMQSKVTGSTTETVDLVNGSTAQAYAIDTMVRAYDGSGTAPHQRGVWYANGVNLESGYGGRVDPGQAWFVVKSPHGERDKQRFLTPSEYWGRWSRIQDQNDALQAEVEAFVNETWGAYQSGEINSADVISRNTQMFRYGNAALNGSESTYDVTAALSSMGLAAPSLNGTGSMVVAYQGTDYNGLILARNAPSGGWDSGTTYNTSNITGPVLLATTGGQTIELYGEFTVSSITAENGETIERVETRKVVYKTANTSDLIAKMDEVQALREEIESREVKASTGGGETDEGFFEYVAGLLGVSVGAAAAVVAAAGLLYLKLTTPS